MICRAGQASASGGLDDRITWQVGALQEASGGYDIVVSLGVVGYQSDQSTFLRALAARVRPGGLLIFTFANALSIPRRARTVVQSLRKWALGKDVSCVFARSRRGSSIDALRVPDCNASRPAGFASAWDCHRVHWKSHCLAGWNHTASCHDWHDVWRKCRSSATSILRVPNHTLTLLPDAACGDGQTGSRKCVTPGHPRAASMTSGKILHLANAWRTGARRFGLYNLRRCAISRRGNLGFPVLSR